MVMTEFAAYLDDSGHPDDQPYVIVAGFLASESQWLSFEGKWNEKLAKHGIDGPLHMKHLGGYHLSRLKREHLLSDLALVIRQHVEVGFSCGVDMEAYKELNHRFALEECLGAPYALAARGFADKLNGWLTGKTSSLDRVLIFVEEGTKHYGDLEEVFKRDKLPAPHKVPKSIAAVQPADLLGWETFNMVRTNRIDKTMKSLGHKVASYSLILRENLVEMCEKQNVPARSVLAPNANISFHSNRKRPRRRTVK
jgi:hypothetical protein